MGIIIKWNEHFNVDYVRKVDSIKKHRNPRYGHIEKGDYLTSKQITEDFTSQDGELYIVCEKTLNNAYVYHVVYIKNSVPLVLFTTPRKTDYPWHENKLVSYIMKKKVLLQNIQVLEHHKKTK